MNSARDDLIEPENQNRLDTETNKGTYAQRGGEYAGRKLPLQIPAHPDGNQQIGSSEIQSKTETLGKDDNIHRTSQPNVSFACLLDTWFRMRGISYRRAYVTKLMRE